MGTGFRSKSEREEQRCGQRGSVDAPLPAAWAPGQSCHGHLPGRGPHGTELDATPALKGPHRRRGATEGRPRWGGQVSGWVLRDSGGPAGVGFGLGECGVFENWQVVARGEGTATPPATTGSPELHHGSGEGGHVRGGERSGRPWPPASALSMPPLRLPVGMLPRLAANPQQITAPGSRKKRLTPSALLLGQLPSPGLRGGSFHLRGAHRARPRPRLRTRMTTRGFHPQGTH